MDPILLCQHCGNKTSQTILEKGPSKDKFELSEEYFGVIDSYYWFVRCNTCNEYSLFYGFDDDPDQAFCLWPNEKQISDAVPSEISTAYKEALKIKKLTKIGFAIMIRRALEILCKYENVNGRNLYDKIISLGDKGIIPKKLTDMADLIRLLGNESAHENDSSISDYEINILDEFFNAIIEYVYIAPEKIHRLKDKISNK